MSIIDTLKDGLINLPISEILKARLELLIEQSCLLEDQVSSLQKQVGQYQAKLEAAEHERDEARRELTKLQDEHSEEVRIYRTIEFRRGKRTGGQWMAFCPLCKMPAIEDIDREVLIACSSPACGWAASPKMSVERMIVEL